MVLAVRRDRQWPNSGFDGCHVDCLISVHFWHHDIYQDNRRIRVCLRAMRSPRCRLWPSASALPGVRERCLAQRYCAHRHRQEERFPDQAFVRAVQRSSMRCFPLGDWSRPGGGKQAVCSSSPSGDSTPLRPRYARIVRNFASSSGDSSRPVNTTTGISDIAASFAIRSKKSNPDMSGSRRSRTIQSTFAGGGRESAAPVSAAMMSRSSCPSN